MKPRLTKFTGTCIDCGREFSIKKSCPDELSATRFQIWADLNCTRCPFCYRKHLNTPSGKITHAIDEILKLLRIIR